MIFFLHQLLASSEEQIFGSKKYNDFGNTFINSFISYGTGGFIDLPNDRSMFSELGDIVPESEYSRWESKCLANLNRTATLELHFSKKDVILATKEQKLSFVGALGNVGETDSSFLFMLPVLSSLVIFLLPRCYFLYMFHVLFYLGSQTKPSNCLTMFYE